MDRLSDLHPSTQPLFTWSCMKYIHMWMYIPIYSYLFVSPQWQLNKPSEALRISLSGRASIYYFSLMLPPLGKWCCFETFSILAIVVAFYLSLPLQAHALRKCVAGLWIFLVTVYLITVLKTKMCIVIWNSDFTDYFKVMFITWSKSCVGIIIWIAKGNPLIFFYLYWC